MTRFTALTFSLAVHVQQIEFCACTHSIILPGIMPHMHHPCT